MSFHFHEHSPTSEKEENLSTEKSSTYVVVDFTKMVALCSWKLWRMNSFGLYQIHKRHVIDAYKSAFLPSLPQVTEPHSCDQPFNLDMSVTCARLLCLSTLTTSAHITFSVGILHTTVQEICNIWLYFWQTALVCNIWNTYRCLFCLC